MSQSSNAKSKLIKLKSPGLVEMLAKRTYKVTPYSSFFHIGMAIALITGIVLEIMYLSGLASVFVTWGWTVMWIHGIFGLVCAVGLIGIMARFSSSKFFRELGDMFWVDAVFLGVISITGIVLLLRMFGVLPDLWGWETTLHLMAVISWLLVSLFREGMVAHAVASIVYRYTESRAPIAEPAFQPIADLNRIRLSGHLFDSKGPSPGPLQQGIRESTNGHFDDWMKNIKCQDACPVHTDARGYVAAIAEGRDEDAYRIARATNPFASICGRVCGAPCEANCRRAIVDAPVSIRALKRFVTEKYGPENGNGSLYHHAYNDRMLPPDRGDFEKVAVVGAGVAGLTVAHDLTRLGYKVTVFEANPAPGGMLTVGVPLFRIPRDLVNAEINAILSLGVELKCDMRLGKDFSISDLRKQGFKAIFLGLGLHKGRTLSMPGDDLPGVYDGLEFLRKFNEGTPLPVGRRVIVIGGGNAAIDCARAAQRLDTEEVNIVYRRTRHEMPARESEIEEALEEGVTLKVLATPTKLIGENGKLTKVECIENELGEPDASGRRRPVPKKGSEYLVEVDTLINAVGQTSDLSVLAPDDGVESKWELIKVDPETYQTTAPDVFAGGDVAYGPKYFIDAIASAQVAARSIHDYLRGTHTEVIVNKKWVPATYSMAHDCVERARKEAPLVGAAERIKSFNPVEQVYPDEEARREASRCLLCNVNTIFDTTICVACLGCVEVCPEGIINAVGVSQVAASEEWQRQISTTFQIPVEKLKSMNGQQLDALGGVMLKDESTCTRCAECAERCPTHALTMQTLEFSRECVTHPSPNPKLTYAD